MHKNKKFIRPKRLVKIFSKNVPTIAPKVSFLYEPTDDLYKKYKKIEIRRSISKTLI